MSLLKPSISEMPEWKLINGMASVFLTGAGFLGIAFIYLRKPFVFKWLLLPITLFGCSIAASHGIYGIVYRIFQIVGVVEIDSVPFNYTQHAFVLWDMLLFEPWFLIEGILLGIVGWCYLNDERKKKIWLILCLVGIMVGLVTGLLGVRFA